MEKEKEEKEKEGLWQKFKKPILFIGTTVVAGAAAAFGVAKLKDKEIKALEEENESLREQNSVLEGEIRGRERSLRVVERVLKSTLWHNSKRGNENEESSQS